MAGTHLSPLQVCAAMAYVGFPSSTWAEGAATAYAESDDDRTAVSKTNDYGLFQINKTYHGDLFPAGDGWKDPIASAAMAKTVYGQQGWGGWNGHGTAKYRSGLPAARAAAAQLTQNLVAQQNGQLYLLQLLKPVSPAADAALTKFKGTVTDLGSVLAAAGTGTGQAVVDSGAAVNSAVQSSPLAWLESVGSFFSTLTQANTWLRIGEFLLGAALIVAGVSHLMAGTSVGRAAKSIGMKAALL